MKESEVTITAPLFDAVKNIKNTKLSLCIKMRFAAKDFEVA
jgi:hypothetical protein